MHSFFQKLKPHGNSIAFVLGFIWDNFMLSRIDHGFVNIMLGSYLTISLLCIFGLNKHEDKRMKTGDIRKYSRWLIFIVQFCFGSLVSGYLILYARSASFAENWPFIVFLVLLVFSNELFHRHYTRLTFQLSFFFILLFSYDIFSLPVLLGNMGVSVFIMSGFVSLILISCVGFLIKRIAPEVFARSRLWLRTSIVLIYILFNIAYFTNIIPPVPLALKEIGIYHAVSRADDGSYILQFEPGRWFPFFSKPSGLFHKTADGPIFVWTRVFAPTKLFVPIFYRWMKYDGAKWITINRLEFPIVGGRDDGYRGYSKKTNADPGRWRVDVETARGELIGRTEFEIIATTTPLSNLVTETR